MPERVRTLPTHSEVIQQLIAERDRLRQVIRLARPFLLRYLAPAAERIEGISALRGEVDRLVRSWPEPDPELYPELKSDEDKVYYDPCQACSPFGFNECVGHLRTCIDVGDEEPGPNVDDNELRQQLDLCLFFLTQAAVLAEGLTVGTSPRAELVAAFMEKSLSPGDLVMERTTVGDKDHDDRRIGWLVKEGREPLHTDEEWEQALANGDYSPDEARPTEQIYHIRTLTGQTVRWGNARFIRLPANHYEVLCALYGHDNFSTARRCSDCGAISYVPPNTRWSQFDPKTGCRNCHGQIGRLSTDELAKLLEE